MTAYVTCSHNTFRKISKRSFAKSSNHVSKPTDCSFEWSKSLARIRASHTSRTTYGLKYQAIVKPGIKPTYTTTRSNLYHTYNPTANVPNSKILQTWKIGKKPISSKNHSITFVLTNRIFDESEQSRSDRCLVSFVKPLPPSPGATHAGVGEGQL